MKRLTRRSKVGEGLPIKHLNLIHMDTTSENTLTEILDKLAEYEDTGLAPEEIKELIIDVSKGDIKQHQEKLMQMILDKFEAAEEAL